MREEGRNMFPEDLILTSGNREEIFEMRPDYPFCIRDVISRYGEKQLAPWHWHEEFEVIHIVEGSMKLQVLSETFTIHEGEIAVINANALHCASGDPYCKLQSLVFSPLLITGNVNSAFASRYILPLISCTRFSAYGKTCTSQ